VKNLPSAVFSVFNHLTFHCYISHLACTVTSVIVGLEFHAVLISTVRSRHLIDKLDADETSNDDDDDDSVSVSDDGRDFGFLSEQKLLNTAMTRAKSWLGVVGDPVALCAVGECSRIWRTYLKHCGELGGIQPPEMSLVQIWQVVESLSQHESDVPDLSAGKISFLWPF